MLVVIRQTLRRFSTRAVSPRFISVAKSLPLISHHRAHIDPCPFYSTLNTQGPRESAAMEQKQNEIIEFWFPGVTATSLGTAGKLWFTKDESVDNKIRENWGEDVAKAAKGEYDSWKLTPTGAVALITLLDQFSRNIYRGDPKTWAADLLCQEYTLYAIEHYWDKVLPFHKLLFCMPLEHSEDVKLHEEKAIPTFKRIIEEHPGMGFENFLKYEMGHYEVVKKYGRYPHRNKILGRQNTPEEEEYLKDNSGW